MKKFTLGTSKEEILRQIPEKTIKKVILGEKVVGLVRIGELFFCFQSFCPHRGASLIQGSINAINELICPLHQYRFDLISGQVKSGSCSDLETFPAELGEKGLEITLPY
jgi:nitrite reductase/ring-hydroxylating ferredoxin subunit